MEPIRPDNPRHVRLASAAQGTDSPCGNNPGRASSNTPRHARSIRPGGPNGAAEGRSTQQRAHAPRQGAGQHSGRRASISGRRSGYHAPATDRLSSHHSGPRHGQRASSPLFRDTPHDEQAPYRMRATADHRRQGSRPLPCPQSAQAKRPHISPRAAVFGLVFLAVLVLGANVYQHVLDRQVQEQQATEQERREQAERKARVQVPKLGPTAWPASTPKNEWQAGTMPHLYQIDPAWAYRPYAGGTVRTNACGPTALCMVYVYLTGNTDYDPARMAAFADAGNYAPTGATEWRFMTQGASKLGLRGRELRPDRSHVEAALRAGHPVICSVLPGDFTNVGHYLVLGGIDDRGLVEVFDPNSPLNSARRWGIQRVLSQTAMSWEFSLA